MRCPWTFSVTKYFWDKTWMPENVYEKCGVDLTLQVLRWEVPIVPTEQPGRRSGCQGWWRNGKWPEIRSERKQRPTQSAVWTCQTGVRRKTTREFSIEKTLGHSRTYFRWLLTVCSASFSSNILFVHLFFFNAGNWTKGFMSCHWAVLAALKCFICDPHNNFLRQERLYSLFHS